MVMGLGQKPYFGTVQYTRDKEETRKNGWYENHSARSLVMKVSTETTLKKSLVQ